MEIDQNIAKSKLGVVLTSLESSEFKKFIQFLESPVFNKRAELAAAAQILFKFHPSLRHKRLTKSWLHSEVCRKVGKTVVEINALMNSLLRLLEDYLVYDYVQSQSGLRDFIMISAFNKRALKKGIIPLIEQARSRYQSTRIQSYDELLYAYLVEGEADAAYGRDQKLPFDQAIITKSNNLEVFYFYNQLKTFCELLSREMVLNVSYPKETLIKVVEWLRTDRREMLEYPTIDVYYRLYQLLKDFDHDAPFKTYMEALKTAFKTMDPMECSNLFDYGSNYCIRRINNGASAYLIELFNIFKFQTENNLLVFEGWLHDRTCKNIVEVSIRVKAFDWAVQFLESHIQYIDKNSQEMIFNYNMANINFAKGDLKAALKGLVFVNIKDHFYQISNRVLLMKIYFQQEDDISLESAITNFKSYLNREKGISELQGEIYKNLMFFITKLLALRAKKRQFSKEKFEKEKSNLLEMINNEPRLADRSWVISSLNQL